MRENAVRRNGSTSGCTTMPQTEADPALDPAPDFVTQDAAMDPWE
jgi:hypothetical protein